MERVPRGAEGSPILNQGNAVHHALERFYGLPKESRDPVHLERALRSVWTAHRRPGSFATKDEEGMFGRQAVGMLREFGERFDLSVEPLAREQWINLRVAGVNIYGKVDRIDRGRDGGIDIIDYKTGRRKLDVRDLIGEPAVQLYVAGAELEYKLPVERVRFIYLSLGDEICWEPEREDVAALKERLVTTVRELQADTVFEARPGDRCRFCPARLHCSERQRVSLDDLQPVEGLPF
jgi:RecB family exonuclease